MSTRRGPLGALLLALPRSALTHSALAHWALALALGGCGGPAPAPQRPHAASAPPTLAELLPLEDRSVSNFRTRDDTGETGLVVLEFYRPRPGLAQIEIAGRIQRLHVRPDAVELATGGYLLRAPLEPGRTFPGAFAQVRIERVDAVVEVPAGHFERCLITVEEAPGKRVETTFCPGVGVARLVVEGAGDDTSSRLDTELVGHGPRVELPSPENP